MSFEAIRAELYENPDHDCSTTHPSHPKKNLPEHNNIQFLDHAWGAVPPKPFAAALAELFSLQTNLGNGTWDVFFGQVMPEAAEHVKRMMGLTGTDDASCTAVHVYFGSNSGELIGRLLSILLEKLLPQAPRQGALQAPAPAREAAEAAIALGNSASVAAGLAQQHVAAAAAANAAVQRHAAAAHAHSVAAQGEAMQLTCSCSLKVKTAATCLPGCTHMKQELLQNSNSIAFEKLVGHLRSGAPASEQLQTLLEGHAADEPQMRVLTSSREFYSLTRQLNRLLRASQSIVLDPVDAEPVETFVQRLVTQAAQHPYDLIYASQIDYLTQQSLLPDVAAAVQRLHDVQQCQQQAASRAAGRDRCSHDPGRGPFIVIDCYHAFGALPLHLHSVADKAMFVSGFLKHVGAGANCAALVAPASLKLQPLMTGWLADPSVLEAGSAGIQHGSEVGYGAGLAMMGATPSFMPCLLTFNHVMRAWKDGGIAVPLVHGHVMELQKRFLEGIKQHKQQGRLGLQALHSLQEEEIRSHTLVFDAGCPQQAAQAVQQLAHKHIIVDCRGQHVRLGFGLNHDAHDVDALINAFVQLQ